MMNDPKTMRNIKSYVQMLSEKEPPKALEFFGDDISLLPQDMQQKLGRISKVKNIFNK